MSDERQRSIFEAEAYGAALRAAGHISATESALIEVGHALDAANIGELARDLGKVAELHRLCSVRFAALIRRLGEGSAR